MVPAEPIVFTLDIKGKFTNLVGPRKFEKSGLHCIMLLWKCMLGELLSHLELRMLLFVNELAELIKVKIQPWAETRVLVRNIQD